MLKENRAVVEEHVLWAGGLSRQRKRVALGDAKDYRAAGFYDRRIGICHRVP